MLETDSLVSPGDVDIKFDARIVGSLVRQMLDGQDATYDVLDALPTEATSADWVSSTRSPDIPTSIYYKVAMWSMIPVYTPAPTLTLSRPRLSAHSLSCGRNTSIDK